jgi:type I restriction-modification system DNA methylase subunit
VSQTRFTFHQCSPEKREKLDQKLSEIYDNIKSRFKFFGTFQDVLTKASGYSSADLKDEQEPEEFAKRQLIEPLIEIMGYEIVPETVLSSPVGRKKPDYTIRPKNQDEPIFYVEAEPFNKDLHADGSGLWQVRNWLLSRASKTDYGIATDGFQWILLKFDTASTRSKEFFKVDLKPIFLRILNPGSFVEKKEVEKIEEEFLKLDKEYVSIFLNSYLERIEEAKEEISKRFYNDYVRLVFGYDEKGSIIKGTCLLSNIITPSKPINNEANLFSVVFMNRLIFIKFLEEKGIVPKDLLKKLLDRYKSSPTPGTFYETYLKLLFYEVFNKSQNSRISNVRTNSLYSQIPYLNGGLFREVIENEKNFNVENEGIQLVLENLLENKTYSIGMESGINPDILGYIFEKTINFISGTGTNQQKMEGAYYTPDDVVEFIVERALTPAILRKMIEGLKESGWSEKDLKGYDSIEDILIQENMPKNPTHVHRMIDSIDSIRVLDPACGSGHFLTAMLSLILRVKESLMNAIGEKVDRYKLKRDIISHNLFGVDIDPNAVEIARLRLWLSLIEEVADTEHVETLPNIDFNIIAGNSLVGWMNEKLGIHPFTNLLDDSYIKETLTNLRVSYKDRIDSIRDLMQKMRIEDTIKAYEALVEIYSLESGENAVRLRETLENIRKKLYEVISSSYLALLKGKAPDNDFDELGKNLTSRTPFHWKVDFSDVFLNGGFDVITGNPPYIEDRNNNVIDLIIIQSMKTPIERENPKRPWKKLSPKKKSGEPFFYASKDCGNTHAYFIERSIKLLKNRGRFGFIVPIALVSTDRMSCIRKFIHTNSSEVEYYNFDDRPGKIFSGIEHCRETIVLTEKGKGEGCVLTSKYHRWHSENRSKLLKTLKTHKWRIINPADSIPKIGTKTEEDILQKLQQKSGGKSVQDYLKDSGIKVWYHNAPQYWIHAHTEEYLPKVEYYSKLKENKVTGEKLPYDLKETKVSSHYKPVTLEKNNAPIINGLLNSSLFYWWFVVWSDGRDLLADHIKSFPISLEAFSETKKDRLKKLVEELMKSYDKNSNIKVNERMGGYAIKIKEIIPSKSKAIIDEIDDIFAECFGFSQKEREFISKFDIEFRMESYQ